MFPASRVRSWMFFLSVALLAAASARGATFTSVASGNWNNPATWGVPAVPGVGDDVTISDGDVVNVTDPRSAASVTLVGSVATGTTTLSIQAGGSLSVGGAVTLADSGAVNKMIEVAGGSLSCATIDLIGGSAGGDSLLRIGNGTATVNGDVKVTDPADSLVAFTGNGTLVVNGSLTGLGPVDMTSGGTLRFAGGGTFLNAGAFNPGTSSMVRYSGNGQSVRATTYAKLLVDGPNVLLTGSTIATEVTIASGAFLTPGTNTLTINGNLTVDGTISGVAGTVQLNGVAGTISGSGWIYPAVLSGSRQIAGTVRFGGNFTLQSGTSTILNGAITEIDGNLDGPPGSLWVNQSGSSLGIGGTVMTSGGALNASANPNTVAYDGATQTVFDTTYWDLILLGSAVKTLPPSVAALNDFQVLGTAIAVPQDDLIVGRNLFISTTATLDGNGVYVQVGGNWTSNDNFIPAGTIVNFNGVNPQTIDQTSFFDVSFDGAGPKSFSGPVTVGGSFTIGPGATVDGGPFPHSVAGNWANAGTFVPNTSTITLNGAVAQSVGATSFYNLVVNGAGILFSGNSSVANLLHVLSGNANVGATTLTLHSLDLDPLTSLGLSAGVVQVSGNLVTDGAFSGGGTVVINGSAIQSWSGTNQSLVNLTINQTSGSLNPAIDLTVTGTLTMTQGSIVLTSPATLYVASGLITHTSGHVNGRLKITFNTSTEMFPFGTTLGNSSVTVAAAVGDTVDMEIIEGPHPSNTGGNSNILQTFWRVHASSAVAPTIAFAWPVAAVSGTEADYAIGFWDGAWSHPSGSVSPVTHTATVSSANPFVGDWTVGEPASLGGAVSFTLTTDGAADAGVPETITITAQDSLGNTAVSYVGSHSLVFTGANAAPDGTLPSAADDGGIPVDFGTGTPLTFSAGVATTDLRLYRVETASIGVSEPAGPATTETFDIAVAAGPMAAIEISDVNGAAPLHANAPFSIDVSAFDAYGNPTTAPADTNVVASLNCGGCTGTLSGTTNGTMLTGSGVATLPGLQYSAAEGGVVIRANTDAYGFADTPALTFATQVAGFVVTNANDSGAGSLRDVLTNVNTGSCVSPCPVTFSIGSGPQTIALSSPLPPIQFATNLDATSQPGFISTPIIVLDGSAAGSTANGFELTVPGSTIQGFAIGGFGGAAIRILTDSSLVRTNWIGLALDGVTPAANNTGVSIEGNSNTIGGTLSGERNVISGNAADGIALRGAASGNTISANYIGTDTSGMLAVPNASGVGLYGDANTNTIGGAAIDGNVISGNTNSGIVLKGITILIESRKDATGRKISTNPLILDGTVQANAITSNFIGVAADGLTALGNSIGVEFNSRAKDNDLGLAGAGNVISGNDRAVVLNDATTTGNRVRANLIGIGADGLTAVPNTFNAIEITSSSDNAFGGGSGEGNTIAHNGGIGMSVVGGNANRFLGNAFFANSGAGIDLNANGADAQDDLNGDVDTGANGTQNYGVISAATLTGTTLDVTVSVDSSATAAQALLIEVFEADASGEGKTLLASTCLAGNTLANAVISMPAGPVVAGDPIVTTATAFVDSTCSTIGDGTSEFSPAVLAAACTPPPVTFTTPAAVCASSGGNTASVPATAGATYFWSITNGTIDAGQGTNAITFTAGSAGSVGLSVTATSSTGCVASNSTTVTITPLPDPTITAPPDACALSTGNIASAPAAAGATYAWTITNGTITAGQGTDSITFTAGSTGSVTLALTVTSASGCTNSDSRNVSITPPPDATITAPLDACPHATGLAASVPAVAGATYAWSITNGTITGGQGTESIIFSAGSVGPVQLNVTVTRAGCSNSSSSLITLKPAPNPTISAPTTADPQSTLSATVPPQTGATYLWSIINGSIGLGQGTNAITFDTGDPGTTKVSVTVTLDGCSKSDTHEIAINDPTPIEAALSISKVAASSVKPNGTIVYTIAVRNAGPSDASNILVNDLLPAGVSVISINDAGWSCGWVLSGIQCSGNVNAGSTRSLTITATAPSTAGSITNTATLTSSIDTTPNDNTASATTVVASGDCEENGVPLITAPAAGAVLGSPVTIAWTAVSNAIDYRVHAHPANHPALDLGTTGGATELTATLPPGTVSITVDAIFAGCADTTSEPLSFTIAAGGDCDSRSMAMPLAPLSNSTAATAATHFQWAPANDPDGYRLWFAVNGGTPAVLGTTVDETSFDGILPAGSIAWWVEALYDGCASTRSPHFTLTVPAGEACSTAVPAPLSPSNGSATTHGEVMFTWTPVDGALAYEVWLSVDDGTPTLMDTTEGTMLKTIVPDGALAWFVRAVLDGCPARDSAVARFTYEPQAACGASLRPIGLAPVTRSHVTSPVDFSWTPVAGAPAYQLFVIRGDGEPELVASTSAAHADDIALSNGKLRWFVRALVSGCTPLDSGEEKLQVVPMPAACSVLEMPQIAAIGQVSSGVPFPIQWSPAPGATRYQLQIASNAGFEGAETVETIAPIHQLTRINTGNDLTPIYVRIRAIDDRCATPVVTPFSLVAGIWVLPVDGVEGSAPTTGDDVRHKIQLGSELKGQTFVASAKEPWLKVEPASGVVADGGTTLVVTADVSTLPVGTTLGSVTVALGDGSVARSPASNASTFNFSTITVAKVTPIMPTPKSTPPPDALIIPAVAHATGINSQFQSDVRLSNSSARTMQYQLTFTPSGESGIAVGRQTIFTVDPGRTVALDDVLRSWFGTGNVSVTGSLEIRPLTQAATSTSSAALTGLANRFTFAASRTFNTTPNGSFGQFIPAVPFANFVGRAAEGAASNILSLQQIAQSDRYRTNLGLLEGSGEPASLLVKVFGQGGQMLKEFPVQLAGGQHLQLNSFLVTNGIGTLDDGRVEVSVVSPGGKVTAYASVLDNATSDPLLVTPVALTDAGNTKWVIPGVADLQNSAANWQTDMRLFNAGTTDVESTLSFYSQNGGAPEVRTVTVPAGQVVQFDRTLANLFGVSNDGGAVHIATSAPARLIATARTYNQTTGGTYGQFISAVTPAETAALNTRPLQILQVEETARFRSNIGVAEVLGSAATVEIAVTPPDAKFTAVTQLQLQPNEFRQLTSLLRSMGLADTYNARVSVRVVNGTGGVTAYASVIDMATNDPTYVPAQ